MWERCRTSYLIMMNKEAFNWGAELRRKRQGKLIGSEILFYKEIDSTNLFARQQAMEGAAEGLVVMADAQSRGKGRRGKNWVSPRGVNVYFSVILRPAVAPEKIPLLTLMAGVASARALRNITDLEIKIKWPNDLMIREKKVAGILTEAELSQGFVILGIGVNVNWPRAEMPEELRQVATSLYAERGIIFSRAIVAQELLEDLEEEYMLFLQEGFSPRLRREWEEYSLIKQRWVTIKLGEKEYHGRALGLDQDGALLVQDGEGRVGRFIAGEVSLRF
ncbi:MAG: biotin--[acetyl-CoA-carboxylase] ligase [Thermodesulfobacteriota bacterium]